MSPFRDGHGSKVVVGGQGKALHIIITEWVICKDLLWSLWHINCYTKYTNKSIQSIVNRCCFYSAALTRIFDVIYLMR